MKLVTHDRVSTRGQHFSAIWQGVGRIQPALGPIIRRLGSGAGGLAASSGRARRKNIDMTLATFSPKSSPRAIVH
jgi:hypothetical protein